jgi:hypothetical protein
VDSAPGGVAGKADRARSRALAVAEGAAMAALFAVGLVTTLNTVLNNAYHFGSNLFDATTFQTIIWRSGWALRPAPVIASVSFLNYHFSPINYLPNAVSYLIPFDRATYYGNVYGSIYGALLIVAYRAFRGLALGSAGIAVSAVGALAFYLSGPVSGGAWYPHQEIASALFTIAFFLALAAHRHRVAAAMLVLNAAVREDCGLLLALPLLGLWLCNRWTGRSDGLGADRRQILIYAVSSVLIAVAGFTVKRIFFHDADIIGDFYFGPDPFAHLSAKLLGERLEYTLLYLQFVWVPGVVLAAAAIWLRDPRLFLGWVAFAPYWLVNFTSKLDINAQLIGYKAFPFILTMVWPALIALAEPMPDRRRLGIVQAAVLLSALVALNDRGVELLPPLWPRYIVEAWLPQPETQAAPLYRAFEARLKSGDLGTVRASRGALALYPYSFPVWWKSQVAPEFIGELRRTDTIFWFDDDRDQSRTNTWLDYGNFPYYFRVVGTRLRFASRKHLDQMPAFAGALEPMSPP